MKVRMLKMLAGVAAAFFVPAASLSAGTLENVVKNGDFREGAKGWSLPDKTWKVVAGDGMKGDGALVWENDNPDYYAFPVYGFKGLPGVAYRFHVLIREDSLKGNTAFSGMEWCTASGVHGGAYGRAVYDNDVSVKDGWVKYEITSAPMPADIGRVLVFAAVRKGAVGRVRFADFSVVPDVQEPVSFFVSSALRDEAATGSVGFFAGLHVNLITNRLEDYVAEIGYRDAAGRRQVRAADEFTVDRAVFRLRAEDLQLGRQDVGFRLRFRDGRTVAATKRAFTRHATMPKRRIAFDSAKRLLIDGKKFFPLGMYDAPRDAVGLKKYLEAPFNFTTQYGGMGLTRQTMEMYAANGVYVAADVRATIDGYDATFKGVPAKTREQSRAAIREAVAKLGGYPALLLWYLTDEVSYNLIPNVVAANEYYHEIDPEHPTFSVQNNPKECEWYLPCCDVLATDCYPVGNHERPISAVGGWVKVADDKMGGFRPAWQVPQAINWAWYFKGKDLEQPDLRFPTRDELANMTWQAIGAGANGICYYDYLSMRKNFKGDDAGFEAAWKDVVSVAKEVKGLEAVLLSDPSDLKPTKPLPPETFFRAWTDGRAEYVLFVNATRQPLKTTLSFPTRYADLKLLLGSGASLQNGEVDLSLPPLGVTLLSLAR